MTPEGVKGSVEIAEPSRAERAIARTAAETRATGPDLALSIDVDQKSLQQLTAEIDDLQRRAAELTSPELSGATFTLAHYGVTRAQAMISPPHAVALAAGEVREAAVVREGEFAAAQAMALDLA